MDTTSASTSRRRVVQGIAWAAPAVAMTAAAPAFAVSPAKCTPTLDYSGGPLVDAGNRDRKTTQQIAFGSQVYVKNLPVGTTVTEVREQWWIENAIGDDSTGDGMWFMGNDRTNWNKSGQCTQVGCSVLWTEPIGWATSADYTTAPNPGWSTSVYNTSNLVPTVFPPSKDGTIPAATHQAWDANLTWTAPSPGAGITPGTGGCNDFTTGPSGRFGVNYFEAPIKNRTAVIRFFAKFSVTLSTGQVLTFNSHLSPVEVVKARV